MNIVLNRNNVLMLLCVFVLLFHSTPFWNFASNTLQNDNNSYLVQNTENKVNKNISSSVKLLVVTKAFQDSFSNIVPAESLRQCQVTYADGDVSKVGYIPNYDALIYHQHNMQEGEFLNLTLTSSEKPVIVLINLENPLSLWSAIGFLKSNRKDVNFHWLLSYERNSNIQVPYGMVIKRNYYKEWLSKPASAWLDPTAPLWTLLPKNYLEKQYHLQLLGYETTLTKTFTKSKVAVWAVSNCNTWSDREGYVNELARYVKVDVYGGCGRYKCGRNVQDECWKHFENTYNFYLSFENSISKDYVTEKFFFALQHDIVPVVFGGADYASIAPPGSYIDALSFSNPRELATHLIFLSENPEEYYQLMAWKKEHFSISIHWGYVIPAVCRELQKKSGHSSKLQSYVDFVRNRLTSTNIYRWNVNSKRIEPYVNNQLNASFMQLYKWYKADKAT